MNVCFTSQIQWMVVSGLFKVKVIKLEIHWLMKYLGGRLYLYFKISTKIIVKHSHTVYNC